MNPLAPLYRIADRLRYGKTGNTGRRGEDLAHRYLRVRGFIVAARNWRPPQGGGEIDIIAWEGDWLVFVEVKTRTSTEVSAPERDIDEEKIRACGGPRAITSAGRTRMSHESGSMRSRSPGAKSSTCAMLSRLPIAGRDEIVCQLEISGICKPRCHTRYSGFHCRNYEKIQSLTVG